MNPSPQSQQKVSDMHCRAGVHACCTVNRERPSRSSRSTIPEISKESENFTAANPDREGSEKQNSLTATSRNSFLCVKGFSPSEPVHGQKTFPMHAIRTLLHTHTRRLHTCRTRWRTYSRSSRSTKSRRSRNFKEFFPTISEGFRHALQGRIAHMLHNVERPSF